MPVEDAADVLGMFDTADHASPGLYTPQGKAPLSISVILDREEGAVTGVGLGIMGTGWLAQIPAAQIPDRPLRGELLSVGSNDFKIETAELDQAGVIWRVQLRKA